METLINAFVSMIRAAVLNGFFGYVVLFGMLALTTLTTLGNWRKIASYVLAWLTAIFAVIVITSTQGGDISAGTGSLLSNPQPVNGFLLLIPAVVGALAGFG